MSKCRVVWVGGREGAWWLPAGGMRASQGTFSSFYCLSTVFDNATQVFIASQQCSPMLLRFSFPPMLLRFSFPHNNAPMVNISTQQCSPMLLLFPLPLNNAYQCLSGFHLLLTMLTNATPVFIISQQCSSGFHFLSQLLLCFYCLSIMLTAYPLVIIASQQCS